jgi:spore coat protein SA
MPTIYHLLDEAEDFSDRNGGAISRWAGNVLRGGEEVVVCPSSDSSWGFSAERVYEFPEWKFVHRMHPALYRSPWAVQLAVYGRILDRLLKKMSRGDLIYVHNRPEYASVLATMAGGYGVRLVLHMHNSLLLRANRGQINALRETPIVFCSEFLRKEAMAAYPGHFQRTYVVYNGADPGRFHTDGARQNPVPVVIYTGRLVPHKGVHVLMEAMRILEQKGARVRCRIVGGAGFGAKQHSRYTRRLERLKPGNTDLVGYLSGAALAEELRRADIFCCPSIWNDPFPLAPIEAMSSGLPVVASSTGGLPETLAHGGGVLVPANDAPALATALEGLVTDGEHRARLGDAARASFRRHFLWSMVRNQYQGVVHGLVA